MRLHRIAKVTAVAFAITGSTWAQNDSAFFRLVSPTNTQLLTLSPDGMIMWSNAATGITGLVQRTADIQAESNWTDFVQYSATGSVSSLRVFDLSPPDGMVFIPAGEYQMGDSFAEGGSDELPVHSVYTKALYIDRHEVTKSLWDSVYQWAVTNGYDFEDTGSGAESNYPVYEVTWTDMIKWCNARSEREGLVPCYYTNPSRIDPYRQGVFGDIYNSCVNWNASGYRLPTEAEWEKAARGGLREIRYPWGNQADQTKANYDGVESGPLPVGSFAPNGYGLFDMAGNVREWCWDWYDEEYYSTSPSTNPHGPTTNPGTYLRVYRGGCYYSTSNSCRVASRFYSYAPHQPIGFRTVRFAQ